MARILFDGEWYDEVVSESLYETDYQRIILQRSDLLYPDYWAIRFDTVVSSEDGTAKADIALIDREYRDWWVVEVEMGHHSLRGHVLPQVRILSRAAYGMDEVDYLCRYSSGVDRTALLDMVKGKQPRVLVVVNKAQPTWSKELAPFGACVAVLEVFRSERNRYVFRVNGEQPTRLLGIVSRCRINPYLPLLAIDSPAALNVGPSEHVKMRYGGGLTEWFRVDSQDSVWLSPVGANPMKKGVEYEIVQLDDGALELRQTT